MNEITEAVKKELETKTHDIMEVANSIIIKTEQENTSAATLMAGWKQEKKRRVEIFAPSKKATKNAYDEVKKLEAAAIDPIEEAIEIVDGKCGAFVQAENRRRAELQRIEDAKVAEAQRKVDEAYAAKCAKASAANKPAPVAPTIIPQRTIASVSKPNGTSYISYFSAKVVNIKDLCLAVAEGREPETLVEGVMPLLNNRAKESRKEGATIAPGVIVVSKIGTSQRS